MLLAPLCLAQNVPVITQSSLLSEMVSLESLSRWSDFEYDSRQASSYNRESTQRGKPGWFADGDGTGFIREGKINGKPEWVIMEHKGPGAITKIWTPFFYYDFNNRVGPNVRIYLNGSNTASIDESLIKLVRGEGSIKPPFASPSARAGNLYLPIMFAKSIKVTMTDKPFYYLINYRTYRPGAPVSEKPAPLAEAGQQLTAARSTPKLTANFTIEPGKSRVVREIKRGGQVTEMSFRLPDVATNPRQLRSTVLSITFDGKESVWCPIGDFFCSADAIHPFSTMARTVTPDGQMTVRWVMPFAKSATVKLLNTGDTPVNAEASVISKTLQWTPASMHFYARWRPDEVVPGAPFSDWNYIDIWGKGVYVGDAWTVLNPQKDTWWGEGDEKIYVDGAWEKGFPTHFGTGTEDYYGWAGGVLPEVQDEFSHPFLANVKVGGLDGHTQGFNILTRHRGLDAIPFRQRLRFDMESSFGTDIRNKWNLLGYSAVTFFYAMPGAMHNRPPQPARSRAPIMSLAQLTSMSEAIRKGRK